MAAMVILDLMIECVNWSKRLTKWTVSTSILPIKIAVCQVVGQHKDYVRQPLSEIVGMLSH